MRVVCDKCSAVYRISDDKLVKAVNRATCKKCGNKIIIYKDGKTPGVDTAYTYKLGILKTVQGNANHTSRHYATYETAIPGYGHCITTYLDDGDPVPSFEGEPYPVSLLDTLEETANRFWNLLDEDNRVALLTKFIDPSTNESEVHIINRYGD